MDASERVDHASASWIHGSRGGALFMQIGTILATG